MLLVAVLGIASAVFVRMDIFHGAVGIFIPGKMPVFVFGVGRVVGVITLVGRGHASAVFHDAFGRPFDVDLTRIAEQTHFFVLLKNNVRCFTPIYILYHRFLSMSK